ncbi:MAG: helix-turn-helix domain-containing protein [Oscillospiraceae bacterium]|nr:helix-turn-helix domain-containing protein [Oscillospiraceae bacterium]
MNINNIPHMETIKNTAKMFGLAEHFIRHLVKSGEIVSVKAGCKYLVNVDKLAEYLNTHTEGAEQEAPAEAHGIKPIPVKL